MTDRQRYDDASDEELERVISCLPRREPRTELRERILSQAHGRQPRRTRLLRPALALGALILLLAVDVLVVLSQDGRLGGPAGGKQVAVAAEEGRDGPFHSLDEIGGSDLLLRIARRHAEANPQPSYFELRRQLMAEGNGG
jgi:hypothetical protein